MPFMTVKLLPGVHAEQTPLLLQAGVIQSNNVRWRDGLPEKIGGWKKFFSALVPGPVRELWAWADLSGNNHLAAAGGDNVSVITGGILLPVTPLAAVRNPTAFTATSGSSNVVVSDTGSNATTYESVTLQTPLGFSGAGGFALYPGTYPIVAVASGNQYTINIGTNATVSGTGAIATVTSSNGSASFTVHLLNHGLSPGSTFAIGLPTAVGGVVLQGLFTVNQVIDANNFIITGQNQATSSATVNYGNVSSSQVIQYIVGAQGPPIVVTAAAAFAAGYTAFAMPPNPGTVVAGMTALDTTTGQVLGTVSSYGPFPGATQIASGGWAAGATTIGMSPNTNAPGIIPGMTVHDDTQSVALGTVASYVGNTLTLAAGAPVASQFALYATAAFTTQYWGLAVVPNPGFTSTGLTVIDVTTGLTLGTVASYGTVSIPHQQIYTSSTVHAGDTTLNMTPYTNHSTAPIIPGMTVFDNDISTPLGTVVSYIGNTLTLSAGVPAGVNAGHELSFSSGSQNVLGFTTFIAANSVSSTDTLAFVGASMTNDQLSFSYGSNQTVMLTSPLTSGSSGASDIISFTGLAVAPPTLAAQAAFTTDYWGIAVPPNPGSIVPGVTVLDQTTNTVLGTVQTYGTVVNKHQNAGNFSAGATTINMLPYDNHTGSGALGPIIPGMTIYDIDQGATLGTVASYIGNTLTLTAPAPFGSNVPGGGDTFAFNSGTQNVLGLTSAIAGNSSGAADVLAFIGAIGPGPSNAQPISADDWCMFNFGSTLLVNPEDKPIFQYDPTAGINSAQIVAPGPSQAHGMFLAMPQQMVVAYGASVKGTQDPMLVAWSDAGNYNTWAPSAANQAGTFRLGRGSKIVGGMQMPMQAMLWTDIGLWLMTYIGYPDVWGFSEIAQECGLIAKKAAGVLGSQVFWMGKEKFWTFSGGQVQPLPCEVWDAIFQNLNLDLVDLIRCGTDTGFDGIGWFFPSLATKQPGALQENDSYVKFNRVTGEWDYGTPIDVYGDGVKGGAMVSDWIDASVYGNPISAMTDSTGTLSQLMWMDMGQDADVDAHGNPVPIHWWIRTGLFMLSDGEDFLFVDRCRPDFKWRKFSSPTTPSAQIDITLYAYEDADNPAKPPSIYGPFLVTDSSGPFDPRARGRYFSIKVEGNDPGSFARLGAVKFRFSPDGRAG